MKTREGKIADVLSIVYPSGEFAKDALDILIECIGEITKIDPKFIDATAFGGQVNLYQCRVIEESERRAKSAESVVMRYLQEQ